MSLFAANPKHYRWISTLAVLSLLVVPAIAHATGSGGGSGSADATTGDPGGDVGSGGAGSGGAEGTGGAATTGNTSGATTTGDTEDSDEPDDDEKGCSIGSRGTLPGLMVLTLLGLHAIRRRD
jgi:hypothetical protein